MIDEMNRGAVAAMPAAEITDIHVEMWNAYQRGNGDKSAGTLSGILATAYHPIDLPHATNKDSTCKRGIFTNSIVRAPCQNSMPMMRQSWKPN